MFDTKDWEPDVPRRNVTFEKKAVKKKASKADTNTEGPTEIRHSIHNSIKKGFPTKSQKFIKSKTKSKSKPNIQLNSVKKLKVLQSNPKNSNIGETGKFVQNPFKTDDRRVTKTTELKKKAHGSKMKKNMNKSNVNNILTVKSNGVLNSVNGESSNQIFTQSIQTTTRKRKIQPDTGNSKPKTKKKKFKRDSQNDSLELHSFVSDKPDEALINMKKQQLNEAFKNDDREDVLFSESKTKPVHKLSKKDKLKKILSDGLQRNQIRSNSNNLRQRMLEKLKAAQFRYLNEKLYTSSGSESQELFRSDPAAFQTYHQGYQLQVKKWPVNPLDIIVKKIQKMPKATVVADMGCGEAHLARRVSCSVRSFDLVATAPGVEACDMAHTPLLARSVDVAVYCLALMGTELTQFLLEASRVLKLGGLLLIAEVESRFDDPEAFSREVARLGFKLVKIDKSNQVFYFLEFKKVGDPPVKKSKLPTLTLKPCLYKRR